MSESKFPGIKTLKSDKSTIKKKPQKFQTAEPNVAVSEICTYTVFLILIYELGKLTNQSKFQNQRWSFELIYDGYTISIIMR